MSAKTATISSVGRQQQQQVDLINEKKLVLYIYSRFPPPPPPPLHFSPCYSASDRLPERLVPIIYGHFAAAAAAAAEMVHRMPGLPAFKTAVAAAVVVVTTQFCSAAAAAVAADTDTGHFWRGTTALTSG